MIFFEYDLSSILNIVSFEGFVVEVIDGQNDMSIYECVGKTAATISEYDFTILRVRFQSMILV